MNKNLLRAVMAGWLLLIGALLAFDWQRSNESMLQLARRAADSHFQQDLLYRQWSAEHGGVYVPSTENTPPNPYLAHIPDRDIVTTDGKRLTLVNPAYMTRQVYELADRQGTEVRGHITSLKPLRPQNAPDDWERQALLSFESGAQEALLLDDRSDPPYVRFMRPLRVAPGCLKCHASQGYSAGDIRGGISISLPYAPFAAHTAAEQRAQLQQYGLVGLVGLIGLWWGGRRLQRANDRVLRALDTEQALSARQQDLLASLSESEARFRSYVDQASDALFVHDAAGRFTDVNRQACAQLGYSREELLRLSVLDVELDFDWDAARALWNGLRPGNHASLQGRHRRKDGTILAVEVSLGCIEIQGQRHYLSLARDISERLRVEAELRQSEALLREAQFIAGVGSYVLDVQAGRWTSSDMLDQIFGIGAAYERTVQGWTDLIHPEDRAMMAAYLSDRVLGAGEPFDKEYRVVRWCDKSERWVHGLGVLQLDAEGRVVGMHGTIRDITARKMVELELEQHRHRLEDLVAQRTAALLQTEARATHILESSASGLMGIDVQGRITFVNPAACALLGYAEDQLLGREAHALLHHSRADGSPYPLSDCAVHGSLHLGQERRSDDEVLWHADGHAVPVMLAVHPMLQDGRVVGAVASLVDMSAQRAADRAREQALAAAENLARLRSEFLANMSHEIRTPLNGVLGFAEIGARTNQDNPAALRAFTQIQQSGRQLLGVIDDILDFSKIEAGKLRIESTEVAVADLAEQALDLVRERALRKGLHLQLEIAADVPRLFMGDPLRIGQVLGNLLSNAVKFTEAGRVTLSAARRGERLVWRVADTGIGMTEQQVGQLFQPFQQADGSISRRFGGTGLGLAISKRILDLMDGEILVRSQPGVGSSFEFTLPCHAAPQRLAGLAAFSAGDRPAARLAGISILAAEDEPINRYVLESLLTSEGATVCMVENGREAVERIAQQAGAGFDVVLMDVQMPEMDGYEATRRIAQLAPGLPVIGQTAHAMAEEKARCLAAGMVDHIAKPLDLGTLVDVLLRHVAEREYAGGK